ncbi:MAG TPA: hypothetical protein PLK12_13540 [Prolixibacteraceae bacterium]|nr:hypothetical protein [Prolixibacteraceae bacterium]
MEQQNSCDTCPMRRKYDEKPKSFAGRFWRFHISFCPGWKMYMRSLDDEQRREVAQKYQLKKWLNN